MSDSQKQFIYLSALCCFLQMSSFVSPALGQLEANEFERQIRPLLSEHCFACHADGSAEGNMSFDKLFEEDDSQQRHETWHRILKQLQAGLMPPEDEVQPNEEQILAVTNWIKYQEFGLNPDAPDPGRVTLRRLNQVEYRNTVRDLLGVDYDTSTNFPADDTGHGFDNIGAVLSMSPLLLEKYVNAAKDIVSSVVPVESAVMRHQSMPGDRFVAETDDDSTTQPTGGRRMGREDRRVLTLSYYSPMEAQAALDVEHPGDYVVRLNLAANESYVDNQFDDNSCEFAFSIDGREVLRETFVRQGGKDYAFDFERSFQPGTYKLTASIKPLSQSTQVRQLRLEIKSVDLIGPKDPSYFVKPDGYDQFFPRDVPSDDVERRAYARELLGQFASRAFRRPVEPDNLERLVDLAESVISHGDTFESSISKAMTAVLASPRFLFREEAWAPGSSDEYPLIDEYSLASRLSYFLWSSMPDAELIALAGEAQLRDNLDTQIDRMLHHEKASTFSENFVGQWLRARVVESIQINASTVLSREPTSIDPEADIRRQLFFSLFRKAKQRTPQEEVEYEREKERYLRSFGGGSRFELTDEVRTAMRRETEMLFEHIVTNDLSLLDLIDSDYTFLNDALSAHYQIEGLDPVEGSAMRLVQLPAASHRGGVLTQGTTLVVTSNPDRTSPVKRGLFILENLLGTPPAAPPPNIPALEDVKAEANKKLSLRETLAIHRQDALCSSCHNQMDPLGLAFENFNALGRYRTQELGQKIEAAGELNSGEHFATVDELKRILVENRRLEIYRCITEKMLTYSLGRAVEYTDAHTIDELVANLEANDGRAQALVRGIIRSSAFQRMRSPQAKNDKQLTNLIHSPSHR